MANNSSKFAMLIAGTVVGISWGYYIGTTVRDQRLEDRLHKKYAERSDREIDAMMARADAYVDKMRENYEVKTAAKLARGYSSDEPSEMDIELVEDGVVITANIPPDPAKPRGEADDEDAEEDSTDPPEKPKPRKPTEHKVRIDRDGNVVSSKPAKRPNKEARREALEKELSSDDEIRHSGFDIDPVHPYMIMEDEFDDNKSDDDKQTWALRYYPEDDILIDGDGHIVRDKEGVVGMKNLERFGETDRSNPNALHIFNPRLGANIEVIQEDIRYVTMLTGKNFETDERRGPLKMRDRD